MWSNRIDISQFIMQLVTFKMYGFDTLERMFTSNEKCLTLSPSEQGQILMNVALTLNLCHSAMEYKHKHKRSTTISSAKLLAIRELIYSSTL